MIFSSAAPSNPGRRFYAAHETTATPPLKQTRPAQQHRHTQVYSYLVPNSVESWRPINGKAAPVVGDANTLDRL